MKIIILLLTMIIALLAFIYVYIDDSEESSTESEAFSVDAGDYDFEFSDRDLDATYDEDGATFIELSETDIVIEGEGAEVDGNIVTISTEGTYILSGALNDGQILIEADEEDKVQIVLDNVSLNNKDGAAIYVKQCDKAFITIAEGSQNSLSSTGEFTSDGEVNMDAVVFSVGDLTLNGGGTLTISTVYGNGISSKDDLVITSGTYKINVEGRALEANDRIKIANGEFYIIAGDDGIHCENSEDDSLGYVYIKDGDFDIISGDDGIHGNSNVTIDGSNILIEESYEGIEGNTIVINDGVISVYSSDDGLNCAGGNDSSNDSGPGADKFSTDEDAYILITGGELSVNADGDGMDSNGNLYISGGTIYVSGPTEDNNGSLDYNGEAIITGGTLVAAGSSGMTQNFSEESTQGSILVSGESYFEEEIELLDSEGNILLSYTPAKTFSSVVISSPDIKQGSTYYVNIGDSSEEIVMDSIIYGVGETQNRK